MIEVILHTCVICGDIVRVGLTQRLYQNLSLIVGRLPKKGYAFGSKYICEECVSELKSIAQDAMADE